MKSFRLLIWSAAICGAAVFTGCVDTADNQLSPMEQEWERVIRDSYPGYRTPKTMPPAVRDSVVYYDAPKAATVQADKAPAAAAPTGEPADVIDQAAQKTDAAEAPVQTEVAPAVKAESKEAPAEEKKAEVKADDAKAESKEAPAEEKKAVTADKKEAPKADKTGAEVTVKAGDTIGGIAKEFYGNAKYAEVILKANPQVKDAKRLKIGTKLIIPAL